MSKKPKQKYKIRLSTLVEKHPFFVDKKNRELHLRYNEHDGYGLDCDFDEPYLFQSREDSLVDVVKQYGLPIVHFGKLRCKIQGTDHTFFDTLVPETL